MFIKIQNIYMIFWSDIDHLWSVFYLLYNFSLFGFNLFLNNSFFWIQSGENFLFLHLIFLWLLYLWMVNFLAYLSLLEWLLVFRRFKFFKQPECIQEYSMWFVLCSFAQPIFTFFDFAHFDFKLFLEVLNRQILKP